MPDVMLAFTNARAGREDAFNSWYDSEHLPQVLAADHMIGGRRMRVAFADDDLDHPYGFLALYDVESGQAVAASTSVIERRPPLIDDVDGPACSCGSRRSGLVGRSTERAKARLTSSSS